MADNASTAEGSGEASEKGADKAVQPVSKVPSDLPQDVRTKLRKLEQLEPKYRGVYAF